MNLQEPELLQRLAGEYVIGTLRGPARIRFEREMANSYEARRRVWQWEKNLGVLNVNIEEIAPPATVWQKISDRVQPTAIQLPEKIPGKIANRFWRLWSFAATAAAVVLAVLLLLPTQIPEQNLPQVALFNDSEAQPLWLISADLTTGKLQAKAVNAQASAVDEAFELWMLPNEGPPQSLGLLPVNHGTSERILPAGLLALLANSKGLAISREPAGGSPTGAPSNVIYQAPLLAL